MASNKIDASKVVWLAPETLHREQLAKALAKESDPDKVAEILASRPANGEFREHLGDEPVDGPDGSRMIAPKWGDLVVWVDDAPDTTEGDGSNEGHFERYKGEEADYRPTVRKDA